MEYLVPSNGLMVFLFRAMQYFFSLRKRANLTLIPRFLNLSFPQFSMRSLAWPAVRPFLAHPKLALTCIGM